jgi:hypothetical protein
LQQVAALKRLAQVVEELQDAYSDKDLNWAAEIQIEWENVVRSCGESDSVRKFQNQVRPVLNWLSEQKKRLEDKSRFEDAVERLRRSIDGRHDLQELNRRFAIAAKFVDFEMPEDVLDAYEFAVSDHQRTRKLRLIIIASSVAAVLVITAIVLMVLILMK